MILDADTMIRWFSGTSNHNSGLRIVEVLFRGAETKINGKTNSK